MLPPAFQETNPDGIGGKRKRAAHERLDLNTTWKTRLRLAARLGIAPRDFWRLSVAEWRALTESDAAPMDRATLDDLTKQFPDRMHG